MFSVVDFSLKRLFSSNLAIFHRFPYTAKGNHFKSRSDWQELLRVRHFVFVLEMSPRECIFGCKGRLTLFRLRPSNHESVDADGFSWPLPKIWDFFVILHIFVTFRHGCSQKESMLQCCTVGSNKHVYQTKTSSCNLCCAAYFYLLDQILPQTHIAGCDSLSLWKTSHDCRSLFFVYEL